MVFSIIYCDLDPATGICFAQIGDIHLNETELPGGRQGRRFKLNIFQPYLYQGLSWPKHRSICYVNHALIINSHLGKEVIGQKHEGEQGSLKWVASRG
jgi:hypothetical protein